MGSAIQWFLFGMFVWGCCVVMSAISRRWAPEMHDGMGCDTESRPHRRRAYSSLDIGEDEPVEGPRDVELRELRKRVETLEAIVTDRKFQWEQDFTRG